MRITIVWTSGARTIHETADLASALDYLSLYSHEKLIRKITIKDNY